MRFWYRAIVMIAVACCTSLPAEDVSRNSLKELNGVIRAVHEELLKLKRTTPWLSAYDASCLSEAGGQFSIYYSFKERELDGPQPQQPSHFTLRQIDLNQQTKFKQWNSFEDSAVCRFPRWHARIYGEVLVWQDRRLEETLKQLVVAKCEQAQRAQNLNDGKLSTPHK